MTVKKTEPVESTEVVPVQDVVGTIVSREGDALRHWLDNEMDNVEVDPGAAHMAIINEIMTTNSVEDLLNLPETSKWDDHQGQTVELFGYKPLDSDFEAGPPVYFVVGGMNLTTNEKIIVITGEQAVMAQLMRFRQLDAFPLRCVPTPSKKPNKFGRHPVRLRAVAN